MTATVNLTRANSNDKPHTPSANQSSANQQSANQSERETLLAHFFESLKNLGFRGDIERAYSERLVTATDNSIYQLMPEGALFPRDHDDVVKVMTLLSDPQFREIKIAARGGGTGTNGQSLTPFIVLDLSRYMNNILHFDRNTRTITVQVGAVKDQINAFLKPFDLFFAPELSTSNRATIGGMVNTDASGQGSCAYGKTSQHIIAIKGVFYGGETLHSQSYTQTEYEAAKNIHNAIDNDDDNHNNEKSDSAPHAMPIIGYIDQLKSLIDPHKEAINSHFPILNRYITGYDLAHFVNDEAINLNHLLCGSEGSLGIFTEITLNLLPIPKKSALVLISYNDFIAALKDAPLLMKGKPTSIEVIDDIVLDIAKNDNIWSVTEQYFDGIDYDDLKALLLIEFNADDDASLKESVNQFMAYCEQHSDENRLTRHAVFGSEGVKNLYGLRKRAVGLLGNLQSNRRPIPFVEDTAVPPENLADFIRDFRAVLDQHELKYGMFGHADAGVIHVRPALDMTIDIDQSLIRVISDKIYALCEEYGGALWGEHGKGVRSEYSKDFFGELYPLIQGVKKIFDPYNQLNPGKIASPDPAIPLYKIDELPLRGDFNRQINPPLRETFEHSNALHCNGNGACFNYDFDAAMCPSYKATRKRIHSPKGRAEMIKEWLRQRSINEVDAQFEEEIYQSLSLCLSCKSCAGECPIKVNIPDAKAEFLNEYHKTRPRPKYEDLLAKSENIAPLTHQFRSIYNFVANRGIVQDILENIGLIDLPSPEKNRLKEFIATKKVTLLKHNRYDQLAHLTDEGRQHSIILIPDVLFSYYDATTLNATIELMSKIGVHIYLAPYQNSGKTYHTLGMLDQFREAAIKQNAMLTALSAYQIPLVGIEPPITLIYRDEYPKKLKLETPMVQLMQEWLLPYLQEHLADRMDQLTFNEENKDQHYQLLSHCTEKSNASNAPKGWQAIFQLIQSDLSLTPTGCCGMSGSFGHLKENDAMSRAIYKESWQPVIDKNNEDEVLATGFSCRTQVERYSGKKIVHPIVKLNEMIS